MGDSTALAWLVLTPFLGLHAKSNLRTESVGSSGQASRLSVTAAGDKRGGFKVCTDHGLFVDGDNLRYQHTDSFN